MSKLNFCKQARKSSAKRIYKIAKIAPPKFGQIEIWRWTVIKEIWRCQEDSGEEVILYMTDDGDKSLAIEQQLIRAASKS